MEQNIDNPLDPFSMDDSPISPKEEVRSEKTSSLLELPKNQGRFSQTSQAILEELRVRHRRLEMHGSAEISPALLLTVDKISEVLLKEVQLTENHKTNAAINDALIELSDSKNEFKSRSVYFYPFLLKSENGITIRIVMIAPQNKDKTDIIPYRRACFKYSEDILLIVFKNLAKQDPILDDAKPGKLLLSRDESGNLIFSPNQFSTETDFRLITEKGFSPYTPLYIADFITDVIAFGVDRQLLFEVSPSYHIVIPSSGYVEILLKHVAVQLDALGTYIFQYLKPIAKDNQLYRFLDKLEDLETRLPDTRAAIQDGGWKIAFEFINFVKEFPFQENPLPIVDTLEQKCLESIQILERLLGEVQRKGKDIYEEKYLEILRKVKEKIRENTVRNLVITPVDIELELTPLFSTAKFDSNVLINRLVDDLSKSMGTYPKKNTEGKIICYAVDQRYLRDVIFHTNELVEKDSNFREELTYLESIRKELVGRNDSQLDLLSETAVKKMETDSREKDSALVKKERVDWGKLQSTFDIPTVLVTTLIGSVLSTGISLYKNELELLMSGTFISAIIGIILGYVSSSLKESKNEPSTVKKGTSGSSSSNEPLLTFVRAAETVLFPKKFNNIFDKVYDSKKLKYVIEENLDEIRNLLPASERKKEDAKFISEIEYAVSQITVAIKVPESVQVKGRSREFIVSKNDLKTLLFRDKLAEHFRKEASVYKNDPDVMSYLNFLIKEIEFGYSKYVKS